MFEQNQQQPTKKKEITNGIYFFGHNNNDLTINVYEKKIFM